MRRKSERNKVRSPEKKVERPSRRTRRRRGTPESEDEPQEEAEVPQSSKEDVKPHPEIITKNPSTDSKESVSNSDEETKEQSVWQVKSELVPSDTGEIQKLKICLQRPSSIERSPRKGHHGSSQESADSSEEVRKKRSKKHYHSNDAPATETSIKQETDVPDKVDESETLEIIPIPTEINNDAESKIVKTETQIDEKPDDKSIIVESVVKSEAISNSDEKNTDVPEQSTENITIEIVKDHIQDEKKVESIVKVEIVDGDLEKSVENVVKSDVKIDKVQVHEVTEASVEKSEKPVEEVDSSKVEQKETTVEKTPEHVTQEQKIEVEVIDNSENKESEGVQEKSHTPRRNSRFDVEVVVDKSETTESKKCEGVQEKSPKSHPPRRNSRFDTRSPEKSERTDKKTETDSIDKNGEADCADKNGGTLERMNSTEAEKVTRKRRWGSKRTTSTDKKPVVAISTDSLKNLISDVKPLPISDVQLEVRNDKPKSDNNKNEVIPETKDNVDTDKLDQSEKDYEPHSDSSEAKDEFEKKRARSHKSENDRNENRSEQRSRRKVSVNENVPLKHSNQPRNKPSEVLYITNLVRPFTVLQLKGMLARTGKLVENGFWIDNIKSKCFVHFENEDQAVETRHALHGTRWPASNPKLLQVEFSTVEEMEKSVSSVPPPPPADTVRRTIDNDRVAMAWLTEQNFKDERIRDREALRDKKQSVREWDMGKQDPSIENMEKFPRDVPVEYPREAISRERREERYDGRDKRRSRSRSPVRRFKRKEEEAPAKRLDDLFKKTKVTPCIYWLPLTPEQIAVKEEMRRQHMAEHERRKEEIRKQERERDRERQSFRERDKSNRRQRSSPGRNMSQNNRSGERNNH